MAKPMSELRREWDAIQWALDQGAYETKEQAKRAELRQLEIEREMDERKVRADRTGDAKGHHGL